MNLKQRIRILTEELRKRGKEISVMTIYNVKIDGVWGRCGSEYEVFERLMEEWVEK